MYYPSRYACWCSSICSKHYTQWCWLDEDMMLPISAHFAIQVAARILLCLSLMFYLINWSHVITEILVLIVTVNGCCIIVLLTFAGMVHKQYGDQCWAHWLPFIFLWTAMIWMLLRFWTRVRGFWVQGAVKRRESIVSYSVGMVTDWKKEN